jgi:hypothetical protein
MLITNVQAPRPKTCLLLTEFTGVVGKVFCTSRSRVMASEVLARLYTILCTERISWVDAVYVLLSSPFGLDDQSAGLSGISCSATAKTD